MKFNWKSIVIKKTNELPSNYWGLGYFQSERGGNWRRNFHELRVRDLALFTLGEVSGKKVLEVGCGKGVYLDILARMGGVISGQDISSDNVKQALTFFKNSGFEADIKVGDAVTLLFEDSCFDAVFSADFIEHISNEQKIKVFAEIFRVLKPGGLLVIKTPNLGYLRFVLIFKRICALLKFKSPFKLHIPHTRNNPDSQHHGLITFKELEKILSDTMFHMSEIIYFPLEREFVPNFVQKILYGNKYFTDHILVKTRKPLFYGYLG